MRNIEFREAEPGDIPGMVELLEVLFSVEADFNFDPQRHRKALERILTSGSEHLALVAVSVPDQRVAAMLTVQTVISTATGNLSGWVEDVVVRPGFQGRGIGSRMLEEAENWARRAGVSRLQLLADKDNNRALAFYSGKGWTGSSMVHRKKMVPPGGGT